MDANIDPSIGDQELYEVSGASRQPEPNLVDHEDTSITNVLRLNEYVNAPHEDSVEGHDEVLATSNASGLHMMSFDLENHPDAQLRTNTYENYHRQVPQSVVSEAIAVSERPLPSEPPAVKLVEYNPAEKTKRLGRPRKNMEALVETSPADSSAKNHFEAKISKFRFDHIPVEGPGSRGGKQGARSLPRGRITLGTIKKRKQTLLNFPSVQTDKVKSETEAGRSGSDTKSEGLASPANNIEVPSSDVPSEQKNVATNLNSEAKSTPITKKRKLQTRTLTSTSRTTVLNSRQKTAKQLVGPLVGLYYDLYDENIIQASQNSKAAEEKLALGFPITPSPYASDILYLVSYLQKFKDVIFVGNLGPQDFEEGLGLNGDQPVSEEMNLLFCKLAALVLNRKREIPLGSQKQAINDLRSVSTSLGLPKRWSASSKILKPEVIEVEYETLDPKNPEIRLEEMNVYPQPSLGSNPFYDQPEFESLGLNGLKDPLDRLTMLVTMAEWSLIASDSMKNYITSELKNHDIVVDKETSYALHYVLKGYEHAETAKRQLDKKNSKKQREDSLAYMDPTSDPLLHPLRLRLDELLVGDCGFNTGRFYLCWMAEGDNGGLTNLRRFKSVRNNINELPTRLPSRFKLYVEDVYKMLAQSLARYGVSFENGEEVAQTVDEGPIWFEVANDVELLKKFTDHLALKLGIRPDLEDPITSNSMLFKPVMSLLLQLSTITKLLERFEGLSNSARSTRSTVDYNEQPADGEDEHESEEVEVFLQQMPDTDDEDYEE